MNLDIYFKRNSVLAILVAILQFLNGALGIYFSIVIGECMDSIYYQNAYQSYILKATCWVVCYAFVFYVGDLLLEKLVCKVKEEMKKDFLINLSKQTLASYDRHNEGEYMATMNANIDMYVQMKYFLTYKYICSSFLTALMACVIFITQDLHSIYLLIVVVAISYAIPKLYEKAISKKSAEIIEKRNHYMQELIHNLDGFFVVKFFKAQNFVLGIQKKTLDDLENDSLRMDIMQISSMYLSMLLGYLATILALFYAMLAFHEGRVSLGYIYVCSSLIARISGLARSISGYKNAKTRSTVIHQQIDSLVNAYCHEGKKLATIDNLAVDIDALCYNNQPVITNFKYTFQRGHKYLIVGENGSGKTTLLKVLLGYYPNYLKVNGNNYEELDEKDYLHKIAVSFQSDSLISNTLAYNISLDNETYGIKPFAWDDQNITINDEANLSLGQIKQVVLSRTLNKVSDVLILDEPINNLDQQSISALFNVLDELNNKIVIVVSHNLDNQYKAKFDSIIDLSKEANYE